jgi:hypothetical protein
MRDIVHNIKAVNAVAPAVRSASVDGDAVDLLGFDSVALVVTVGAVTGSGNMSVKLQESDASGSGFADVDPDHLQGAGLANPLTLNGTTKIGYRGFKRYLRAVLTLNSGTSVTVGALFILGNAVERPVA